MSSIYLDKFAEQIISLRDEVNKTDPDAASRLQVHSLSGQAGTVMNPDDIYPGLNNLQGAHFHRPNEEAGLHGTAAVGQWPECIIIQ